MQAILAALANALVGAIPKMVNTLLIPFVSWIGEKFKEAGKKVKNRSKAKKKVNALKESESEEDINSSIDNL